MAGPEKLPQPVGLESQAAALLQLLGGTKTTTSPGDTTALQGTLAGLKGVDYEAMLKAIFQQAGSQIPGLQQALGNAIGARSGGNSAVQAALQKLLAQTSTGAMDQVAKLQAQNFQTQANVGNSIAQATQGTTKKSGTDIGTGATNLAAITAALQAAKALGIQDLFKSSTSSTPAAVAAPTGALNTSALTTEPANYSLSSAPAFSSGNQFSTNNQLSNDYTVAPVDYSLPDTNFSSQGLQAPVDNSSPYDYQLGSYDYSLAPSVDTSLGLDYQPNYSVPDYFDYNQPFEPDYSLFADGGLVTSRPGKAEGYADGGTVRAGGSRRSANPTFTPQTIDQSLALRSADALRNQFKAPAPAVIIPSNSSSTDTSSSVGNSNGVGTSSGNGGNSSFSGNYSAANGINPASFGNAVNKIGALNALSGVTGGPTLGPGMGVLGLSAGLANAKSKEEALGLAGKTALNIAAPGLGSVVGFVGDPSLKTGINMAASLNPIGLGYNALASLFGFATAGEVVDNARALANPNQMMTPAQQSLVSTEANNPSSAGLTSQANGMPGDALDNLMGLTNAFGTGGGGRNGGGGGGFGGGDSSNAGGGYGGGDSRGAGDTNGGTSNGNAAAANGGLIDGPGTGTSDSIDIKVSDGETVITAETTKAVNEALGENFFLALEEAFNPKAAKAQRQMGRA